MAGENDASFLVRMPSQMLAAVKEIAGERGAGGFIREAIQERLDGLSAPVVEKPVPKPVSKPMPGRPVIPAGDIRSVSGKPDKDPRFEVVFAAIRKRGRATVRQIVSDTGLSEGVVEMVLRRSVGSVGWPLPGVAEMVG